MTSSHGTNDAASTKPPLVSVGVPVYQGEEFLDETLAAIRAQDYANLEILISDNASTDNTSAIVQKHAAQDPRIKTITQTENIGAAENYNEVFRAASGEYFAWNAHDDLTTPGFYTEGSKALQADPQAVVAIARPFRVDLEGNKIEEFEVPVELYASEPHIRFRAAARSSPEALVFGLYRTKALASTRLHGHFAGSDRNLISEAMLYGRVTWAGTSEFHLREHELRSVRTHDRPRGNRLSHSRDAWYDPARKDRMVFPNWRRVGGYFAAVAAAPLGFAESARCYFAVVALFFDDRAKLSKQLVFDLLTAGSHLLGKLKRNAGQ